MTEKRVLFDRFALPILKGLQYLMDEEKEVTDYLFINEAHENFSMYFELGQKPFEAPSVKEAEKEYCLFELKRPNRRICFYCPERTPSRESEMWYFYVELFDEDGNSHVLPGQIRLDANDPFHKIMRRKPKFIDILDRICLNNVDFTNLS